MRERYCVSVRRQELPRVWVSAPPFNAAQGRRGELRVVNQISYRKIPKRNLALWRARDNPFTIVGKFVLGCLAIRRGGFTRVARSPSRVSRWAAAASARNCGSPPFDLFCSTNDCTDRTHAVELLAR